MIVVLPTLLMYTCLLIEFIHVTFPNLSMFTSRELVVTNPTRNA